MLLMSKHTYGFPAGTDKTEAVASALAQAVADGFIASTDAASTEILETEAHRSDADDLVHRRGKDELMPHAPEFVVVVRPVSPASL